MVGILKKLKLTEKIGGKMGRFFLLVPIFFIFAFGQDSLPWQGTIVFGPWVRVDDADSIISGHPAYHPQTILDEKSLTLSGRMTETMMVITKYSLPVLQIPLKPGQDRISISVIAPE